MTFKKIQPIPIIEDELYDDEELFWWGQPAGWHFIRGQDITSIVMGLGTAAVGLFFLLMTRAFFGFSGGMFGFFSLIFAFVPLMFVLSGLAPIGAVVLRWFTNQRTYYGVTNKRALIITDALSRRVRSFYDAQIEGIESVQHRDGTGDVYFASEEVARKWRTRNAGFFVMTSYSNFNVQAYRERIGFIGIPQAREVEDLMTQLFIEGDEEEAPRKRKPSQSTDEQYDSFTSTT